MTNLLCMLAISKAEDDEAMDMANHLLEKWLAEKTNLKRLELECEKILTNCCKNPGYDPERAFSVLAKRLNPVAKR